MKQRMLSLLLAMVLLLAPCISAQAVTTVNLEGVGVSGNVTPGTTTTGNFSVTLSAADDSITALTMASAGWNEGTRMYTAAWHAKVSAWLSTGNGKAKYSAYTTPALLAAAPQTTVDAFYKDFLTEYTTNTAGYSDMAAKAGTQTAGSATWNYTDMPFGQYLILGKAQSGGDYYTPITVNLVPERDQSGTWIVVAKQVRMKFGNMGIEKTISDDTVGVGDLVDFAITAGMPNYTDSMNSQKKIFIIDDDMNPAFSYNDGSLKVSGQKEDGSYEELPSDYYSAVISSEVTIYTCPTSSHQYFNIYMVEQDGTKYFYFLQKGVMNLLYSTKTVTSSTLSYSGPVFKAYQSLTGDRIGHGLRAKNETKNLFNVNFDYEKMAAAGYTGVKVEYSAMVTEEVQIGTNGNTNTAYLWYAKDENGTTESTQDKVTAWSYGANIVKVDGDTLTNNQIDAGTTYLAGATFLLYEKVGTYDTIEGNSQYEADLAMYQKRGATRTIPVYDTDGVTIKNYELYFECRKNITSIADGAGVNVNGLHPGDYLLEETLAPEGYNLLAQALKFSIVVADANEANGEVTGKRSSQIAFRDDAGELHSNGYYDLIVQNFKGLMLPNTGGMGTTALTILGFMLMMGAMGMILWKIRRDSMRSRTR